MSWFHQVRIVTQCALRGANSRTTLVDPENNVSITFQMSTFNQENLDQAASQLENKKVVYGKIGKVKKILPAVKYIVDALGSVSSSQTSHQWKG